MPWIPIPRFIEPEATWREWVRKCGWLMLVGVMWVFTFTAVAVCVSTSLSVIVSTWSNR
ncbi:MAG: hypothetical protein ACRCT8_12010 [Lacipirellulaceae bacterium]